MTNPTDAPLSFTEKPGTLFVAPLGTDLPDHTVKDGIFIMSWSASWIQPLGWPTDPVACSIERTRWSFGASASNVLNGFLPASYRHLLPDAAPRFMVGWEASDRAQRIIARQAVVENGRFRLEQAYRPTPPSPAPRPWWHRPRWLHAFFDRWQQLLRPQPEPEPTQYPPYEMWTVGTLRRTP